MQFLLGHNSFSESHCYKWQPNSGSLFVNLGSSCVQAGGGKLWAKPCCSPQMTTHMDHVSALAEPHKSDQKGQTFYPKLNCSFGYQSASDLSLKAELACAAVSLSTPHCFLIVWVLPPSASCMCPLALVFLPHTATQWDSVVLSPPHRGSVICSTTFQFGIFCHRLSRHVMQANLLMVLGICWYSYLYKSSGFACGPYTGIWLPQGT